MKKVFIVYETNTGDGTSILAVCDTEEKAKRIVTTNSNAFWFTRYYYEEWKVI